MVSLPGGLHNPRQRCGRCPQHRRSSPVSGLNGPLSLTLAPDDDVIAVTGSNGNAVEITPSGRQTAKVRPVRRGAAPVFGVTPQAGGHGLLFVNGTSEPWTCSALAPAMARPPPGAAGPGQR